MVGTVTGALFDRVFTENIKVVPHDKSRWKQRKNKPTNLKEMQCIIYSLKLEKPETYELYGLYCVAKIIIDIYHRNTNVAAIVVENLSDIDAYLFYRFVNYDRYYCVYLPQGSFCPLNVYYSGYGWQRFVIYVCVDKKYLNMRKVLKLNFLSGRIIGVQAY